MNNQQFNQDIRLAVEQWVKALFNIFKANIAKKNLVFKGDLRDGFMHYVQQNAAQLTTRLQIEFAAQGRFQDMRTLNYSKMPPLDAMMDFVKKKGLGAFQYVPSYSDRSPARQDIAIRRIAWGIRASFAQRGQVKPAKKWKYAKTFYSEVSDLRDRLQILLLDSAGKFAAETLQNL